MKLAVIGLIVGSVTIAHARAEFDEYGRGISQRPAQQLYETSCDLDVELRGAVATVELRQRIYNPGPTELGASLELELPRGAQVISFSLRGRAGDQIALPVAASSPTIEGTTPGISGADPAVLARRPDAGDSYHVILQPIGPERDVIIATRYVALAEPRGGALRLVLPGRDAGKLAPCRGTVRTFAGPGARVRNVRIGTEIAARRPARFELAGHDVAILVELEVSGKQPIAWTQTQPLADGWNASVVTVLGPQHVRTANDRQVVFVIDSSRSMELVGRHNVAKVVARLGAALPPNSQLEAILFDRTPTRVFGELRPASPDNIAVIEAALARRGGSNGSDVAAAFALARTVLTSGRGQAMVILITDGVIPELDGDVLSRALDAKTSTVDVHAIVLDPAATRSPSAATLRGPINLYGGAYVELAVDELDDALATIDEWLRPAWLELALGPHSIPTEVSAGGGFTRPLIHKGPLRGALTGHGDARFSIPLRSAPPAPIAALALATASPAELTGIDDPTDAELIQAEPTYQRALGAHPFASKTTSFAVLAASGKVARSRLAVTAGGGRYERIIAVADPEPHLIPSAIRSSPNPALTASAIARSTLERLFRDQLQPKAFTCYQRALGRNPRLAGTAQFRFRLGRGEVTHVELAGLGDPQLDACLLDAAYLMSPPMPDFTINADDQTIANYPLTFNRREDQPYVVLGDADSSSPIDIDAIQAEVPGRRRDPLNFDTSTPLGGLRPSKSP